MLLTIPEWEVFQHQLVTLSGRHTLATEDVQSGTHMTWRRRSSPRDQLDSRNRVYVRPRTSEERVEFNMHRNVTLLGAVQITYKVVAAIAYPQCKARLRRGCMPSTWLSPVPGHSYEGNVSGGICGDTLWLVLSKAVEICRIFAAGLAISPDFLVLTLVVWPMSSLSSRLAFIIEPQRSFADAWLLQMQVCLV